MTRIDRRAEREVTHLSVLLQGDITGVGHKAVHSNEVLLISFLFGKKQTKNNWISNHELWLPW
jgi:hypothetical protein